MRAILQRVSSARVEVGNREIGAIGAGLVVLTGVERGDGPDDVGYVAQKVRDLRIFDDEAGKMNRSVAETGGAVLAVSQFTLCGDCRKGRRPSFDAAEAPAAARRVFDEFVAALQGLGLTVATGEFQARMAVSLVNDGPVTVILDSRRRW